METGVNQKPLLVMNEIKKSVIGKDDCIKKVMTAALAGGHILIEDIPGVGKTTLALAFSKSMGLTCHRMQFTPDVLPADITGFSLYQKTTNTFEYQPGAIMCNLFLADEINRTSPKTQSALLEVMEEGKVTVDGVTRMVPSPFIVMATQNPSGSAGTQLLPESQLDRFMIRMTMGYPDMKHEIAIAKGKSSGNGVDELSSVIDGTELMSLRTFVNEIYVHDQIYDYIGKLVTETRNHTMIDLGVSPRGTIALTKMAKAYAFLGNRGYVIPEDVWDIFGDTILHRVVLSPKARANHVTLDNVMEDILKKVPKPTIRKGN